MSWQATAWAEKQKTGSPSRKVLLLILANYADEHGICWPSQETISAGTEQSIDTVQRQTKRLVEDGFMVMEKRARASGRWPAYTYRLNMKNGEFTEPQNAARCFEQMRPGRAATSTSPGRKLCGMNLQEPSIELSSGKRSNEFEKSAESADDKDANLHLETGTNEEAVIGAPTEPMAASGNYHQVLIVSDDPQFAEFQAAWGTSAIDNVSRTMRAWGRLSIKERVAAIAGIKAFKAELERAKRTIPLSGWRYLGERKWQLVAAATAAFVDVKPLSRDWWALLFHKIDQAKPIGAFVQYSLSNTHAMPIKRDEMPGLAQIAKLDPYPSGGEVAAAWRPWLQAHGVRVPARDALWIFLPGTSPPTSMAGPPWHKTAAGNFAPEISLAEGKKS